MTTKIKDPAAEPTVADKVKNFLSDRQRQYIETFSGDKNIFGKKVLADLARFCRANESTYNIDPRAHALLEGRREVWLRIRDHIELDPESFAKKYIRKGVE